jgi:cell division protein FtsB
MDLAFFIPTMLANITFVTGYLAIGYILVIFLNFLIHYIKYKNFPLSLVEQKYINLLEENKLLKQKIAQFEEQQDLILEQMINQLKEK